MRPQKENFLVSSHSVEFTKIPVRTRKSGFKGEETERAERSLYEIRIDGLLVGLAVCPFGIGKPNYKIERLYTGYLKPLGYYVAFGDGYIAKADRLSNLDMVAQKAYALRSKQVAGFPSLPTKDEIAEMQRASAEAAGRSKVEAEARDLEWKANQKREREAQDANFEQVVEGLKSIDARHGALLSNSEANALRTALEKYVSDRGLELSRRMTFEDPKYKGQ